MSKNDDGAAKTSGADLAARVEALEKSHAALAEMFADLNKRLSVLERAFPVSSKQAPKTRTPE